MALLTLHRKQRFKVAIPYWVFIDGQSVGMMRSSNVGIDLPEGSYNLAVKIVLGLWKWRFDIGGDTVVTLSEQLPTRVRITDRERWWNLLFDLDLVIWIACMFIELPAPWNVVYHILSEGFFAIWMIRILVIRNRYFKLMTSY